MTSLLAAGLIAALPAPGLAVGDSVSPFEPYWINGDYADTNMCPVCEYTIQPMVYVWTHGNGAKTLQKIVTTIDAIDAAAPEESLHTFLVEANQEANDKASIARLRGWVDAWKPQAMAFLSRPVKLKVLMKNYKLEEHERWKTVVYVVKGRKVTQTFVDPSEEALPEISAAINAILAP